MAGRSSPAAARAPAFAKLWWWWRRDCSRTESSGGAAGGAFRGAGGGGGIVRERPGGPALHQSRIRCAERGHILAGLSARVEKRGQGKESPESAGATD